MARAARLDVSEFTNLNRIARWFVTLRWIACAGVCVTLVAAWPVYGSTLPMGILFGLSGILALCNACFQIYHAGIKQGNLSKAELSVFFNLQICFDYLLLLLLIYFTGYLENPFAYFFVFYILLTAYIFSADLVFVYTGALMAALLAVAGGELLGILPHFPLFQPSRAEYLGQLVPRAGGLCATLAISGYLGTSIRKRLEEKTQRVEVELSKYRSLERIKSNFILQVTHELRGPLAAINGYHEMIGRGITGAVEPRTLETIHKAERRAENLLTMIDEMIDYAYMQTDDKVRFTPSPVLLRAMVDANVEAIAERAAAKKIRFEVRCASDISIQANRDLINIILNNLLTNSVKYSPAGSVVSVSVVREAKEVCVEVKDQGMGMSLEELGRIFEEFYRTRRAREAERDGTGLGLSIIKKAVEALHGRITVASEVDKGTTFHIYFPKGEDNG